MRNKILGFLTAVLMLVSSSTLCAQSTDEIEAKMNEIKLNENMIYGEERNNDKDIAYNNALSELLTYANELRAKKGIESINISDLRPVVKELTYFNRDRHTVLVYMPLSEMFSLITKPIANNNPQDKPNKPSHDNGGTKTPNNGSFNGPLSNDILYTLCNQDNWLEIKGLLYSFKEEGKISSTGAVQSYADVPEDAYAILLDEMGGILSILSPKNSDIQINCRTNMADNERNYSNCKFIVWYK